MKKVLENLEFRWVSLQHRVSQIPLSERPALNLVKDSLAPLHLPNKSSGTSNHAFEITRLRPSSTRPTHPGGIAEVELYSTTTAGPFRLAPGSRWSRL